ncbi:hypothetical protein JCM24511_07486 [Saitozyma sp. JCM 24511]|nr:hypothetical protein JCM24511_07486 [Saitozyma sp. JCM 24511]
MVRVDTLLFGLALALPTFAAPAFSKTRNARDATMERIHGVASCPAGWKSFVTRNAVALPDVLGDDVWALIGNFCDPAWQGFDVHSIKGNCPSSKTRRTLGAFDLTFTDRLDLHIVPAPRSPSSKLANSKGKSPIYGKGVDGPQAQVHAAVVPAPPAPVPAVQAREDGRIWVQSWNTLGMPTFGDLRVKEMYHLLKVQESETGAVVSWDATGCSPDPEDAAFVLEEVHDGALNFVAMVLGEGQSSVL